MPKGSEELFLDYGGSAYPVLGRLAAAFPVSPVKRIWHRFISDSNYRRNPRTADYMRSLVEERHGTTAASEIRTIGAPGELDRESLRSTHRFVLLWRDGNGSGWLPIEKTIFRSKPAGSSVVVLNGRRREFELTPQLWRRYRLRRILEKSFALELAVFTLFWIATPIMVLGDRLKGQR